MTFTPACFASTVESENVFSESDEYSIRICIDYVQISGDHWLFTPIGTVATHKLACTAKLEVKSCNW